MSWLILAASGQGTTNLAGTVFHGFLPILVLLGVIRVLIEIMRPARRSTVRRRRLHAKREMTRGEAWTILAAIVLVAFCAFECWLWKCKGAGGRFLAMAILAALVASVVTVMMKSRKRTIPTVRRAAPGCRDKCQHYQTSPRSYDDAKDADVAQREGDRGEAIVRAFVKSLPPDQYVVLHDVWLPMAEGDETQIDHLIVSPFGIFVVETKNWKGTIYADAKSPVWTKYNHGHKATYQNPIRQNYKHIMSIREKFSRSGPEFVFGIVAMSCAAEFKGGVPDGVVFYKELKGWILGHVTPCIKPEQVVDIVAAIQEWSSTVSEDDRRRHCGKGISDAVRKWMDLGFSREDAEARLKTNCGM